MLIGYKAKIFAEAHTGNSAEKQDQSLLTATQLESRQNLLTAIQ